MKKVKIMLLSLVIFAVVGAALAFKAKDVYLCIANYNNGCPAACPKFVASTITTDALATRFCYGAPSITTTIIGGQEQEFPISTCTTYTDLDINKPNNATCTANGKLKPD